MEKQEVLDLFRERIHPQAKKRAKLSIHLQSQKPSVPRVSGEAMKAFESSLQEANIVIDVTTVRAELDAATPTATEFVNAWREVLTEDRVSGTKAQDLLEQIPGLIERYPLPGEDAGGLPTGVTSIEELKGFKATLRISDPPRPLIQWNDLPASNL